MRECITHHHACDCREAKMARLGEALEYFLKGICFSRVAPLAGPGPGREGVWGERGAEEG